MLTIENEMCNFYSSLTETQKNFRYILDKDRLLCFLLSLDKKKLPLSIL